jgi:hypothetical protein
MLAAWLKHLLDDADTPYVEHRDERIVVETDRHRIIGYLHLPRDGYRSRLTDYLNASDRSFIALTDVEVCSLEAAATIERRPFLALSLSHIVYAMPASDSAADSPAASGRRAAPAASA